MATVLLAWAGLAIVLLGLGYLLALTIFHTRSPLQTFSDYIWLGFAGLVGALQFWHFLWPVDWRCVLIFASAGLVGIGLFLRHAAWRAVSSTLVTVLVLALPILLLVANQALDYPRTVDSGMYHFQSIRWINAYPLVPGLGQLNIQLGLNQSFFLFGAFLNVFPFHNQGYHIGNSFLLAIIFVVLLHTIFVRLRRGERLERQEWLAALLLPALVSLALNPNLHSPSPDFGIVLLNLVIFWRFCAVLFQRDPVPVVAFRARVVLTVSLMVLVALKISNVALAGLLLLLLWGQWWRSKPEFSTARRARVVGLALGACFLLILIPTMIRGVFTSGYPLFPATVGGLPVKWSLALTKVEYTAFYIRYWPYVLGRGEEQQELQAGLRSVSTRPGYDPTAEMAVLRHALGGWRWVRPLLEQISQIRILRLPALLFLPGFVLAVVLTLRRRRPPGVLHLWIPMVPLALAVLFWLITAPLARFALALFWLGALWTWAISLTLLTGRLAPVRLVRPVAWGVAVLCLIPLVMQSPTWKVEVETNGFARLPTPEVSIEQTDSGLRIHVCRGILKCWDADLPTTPYLNPKLALLNPEKGLAGGFYEAP